MWYLLFATFLIYLVCKAPAANNTRTGTGNTSPIDTGSDDDHFSDYLEMDYMSDGEINGR